MEFKIEVLLDAFQADETSSLPLSIQKALYVARRLQQRAIELQTPQERRQQAELDRMIHNPQDKSTLTQLTDQAFRAQTPHRAVDQLIHILDVQGIPRFFSPLEKTLLRGFQSFGSYLPGVAVPLVKGRMHRETANVILPAEREMLAQHLRERRDEGVRMNVNYLGEALLGEEDAERRLQAYLKSLQQDEIEVISVKISTLYSQISALARNHSIGQLCDRMELLYRASAKAKFQRSDGTIVPKFVYMDMEEYRDMSLTAEVFMTTLDRKGLQSVSAGIVLQAYIPDSFRTHQRINDWARARVAAGGAPITLRIVKGANMEMERVEASLRGWPAAPYQRKIETDANYKRMVHEGMRPENLAAVRLGIASHNLFELAYALVLADEADALNNVQFEMLEGMANHQRRALFEFTNNLLLYAPACKKSDFIHAIGYLIRRLDENTGPDNFLRHAFRIDTDSEDWTRLEQLFLDSFDALPELSDAPRRQQDRHEAFSYREPPDTPDWRTFTNEPDTDFSLPENTRWAEELVTEWLGIHDNPMEIPLVIAGERIDSERQVRECRNPSQPDVVVGHYHQATRDDIELAVACARRDDDGWRKLDCQDRARVLHRVAHELRVARPRLIGAAMIDGGKTVLESDPEVSEAIDFAEFYGQTAVYFDQLDDLQPEGKGVVAVVSPWNFPIAIPCGGIAAALAAGNTVILKPASDTVLVAYEMCRCFWQAGVSEKTLQFAPCAGSDGGAHLVGHDDVDVVILTGGTETALRMLKARPDMHLLAETGGKNATIVTALSDRDLAIKNVLHSAFGHSGQKCSATSLLILEDEVYNDESFKRALCDAVQSIQVGPAHELENRMGPLIRPPDGDLEQAIKELEEGESWAVMPRRIGDNPHLYSPGVKWGVTAGSYTHCTEFFGPLLAVMRARNLTEAIHLANQTGYGLTSGLESLDDREQDEWRDAIRAGNLYINRPTTGAVVLRQPFGGMGKSAFGPGIKAGGPNYVAQLMNIKEISPPSRLEEIQDEKLLDLLHQLSNLGDQKRVPTSEVQRVVTAAKSFAHWHAREFSGEHDHFLLVGQDNLRRYLAVPSLRIRIDRADSVFEVFSRVCAAKTVGSQIAVSYPHDAHLESVQWLDLMTNSWGASIEFIEESDDELADAILNRQADRLRYADPDRVPDAIRQAAPQVEMFVADAPILQHGRIELLWYLLEQSICLDYHRYGNLGTRGGERRADVF